MPTYDVDCPECGRFEALLKWTADPNIDCPECGHAAFRRPCASAPTGILPTKPLVLDNKSGKALHTNSELREFERKHPNVQVVAPNDRAWTNHVDRVKNLAETRAVKRGYRDFKHQSEAMRDRSQRRAAEKKNRKG